MANPVRLSAEHTLCQGNAAVQEVPALTSQKRPRDSGDMHAGGKDHLSAQLQRLGCCPALPSTHLELLYLTCLCELAAVYHGKGVGSVFDFVSLIRLLRLRTKVESSLCASVLTSSLLWAPLVGRMQMRLWPRPP